MESCINTFAQPLTTRDTKSNRSPNRDPTTGHHAVVSIHQNTVT